MDENESRGTWLGSLMPFGCQRAVENQVVAPQSMGRPCAREVNMQTDVIAVAHADGSGVERFARESEKSSDGGVYPRAHARTQPVLSPGQAAGWGTGNYGRWFRVAALETVHRPVLPDGP